jgi:N-hydroxyarylamine O-acetyltransferase
VTGGSSLALGDDVIERYFARTGLDGSDRSLPVLQAAHVRSVLYENLDVRLGREIRLEPESLVAKMVDRRRGGYCFEQNTLFAAVLESVGFTVTRCLGRVRLGDPVSPRPATHMVLLVDGRLVDVGFGSATPLGPVPLGGEATYDGWTWRTEQAVTPEGGACAWEIRLFDLPLYTFTEAPQHPVDYIAPNHYTSTHPQSRFTQLTTVQLWEGDVQLALTDLELTERRADGTVESTPVDPGDLGEVLRGRFGLELDDEEIARLTALAVAALSTGG